MDKKITLAQLAEQIAKATGSNAQTASTFIQDLAALIAEALKSDGTITINGLGTFSVSDNSESLIVWRPDDTLAENVNQPFEAFEPVELEDEVTEDILEGTSHVKEPKKELTEIPEKQETEEGIDTTVELPSEELAPEPEPETGTLSPESQADETSTEETFKNEEAEEIEEDAPETQESFCRYDPESADKPRLNPWLMLTVGLLAGFIIGYFSAPYLQSAFTRWYAPESAICDDSASADESLPGDTITVPPVAGSDTTDHTAKTTGSADSIRVAPPAPAPALTDTVSAHRYLTTMSRKYFGDYRFWVYIYLENSDIIDNPDKIRPGTVVKIPSAEKYGIDSSDPESIAKANEMIRSVMGKLDK